MKWMFRNALAAVLLCGALAGCQKEKELVKPEPLRIEAPASTGPASNLAANRLTKITVEGNPYTAFTYDWKGRIATAKSDGRTTVYTYGYHALAIKTYFEGKTDPISSYTGTLDAQGRLTYIAGYSIYSNIKTDSKHWYTYDAYGQLIQSKGQVMDGGVMKYGVSTYVWSGGNLMKQTYLYDNKLHSITLYEYDLAKKDLTGLWNLVGRDWSDTYLGKRPAHHLKKITEKQVGIPDLVTTFSWTVNSAGYATASVWVPPFSSGWFTKLNFQYYYGQVMMYK